MVKRILSIILLLNLLILSTVFEQNAEAAGVVSDCANFGTYTTEGTLAYALYLGGEVVFNCTGTIPISTHILITENTVINANQNDVVLSGIGNTESVFWVDEGVQLDLLIRS